MDLRPEAARAGANMRANIGWLYAGAGRGEGWLAAMSVARGFVLSGGIGRERVRFLDGGLYEPADDGVDSLLLGAWSDRPTFSDLVDTVAIEIGGAGRPATRLGRAFALCCWSVETFPGAVVSIHASAWDWLQDSAAGILILEPAAPEVAGLLLYPCARYYIRDRALGLQLHKLLRQSMPRVLVPDD